MDSNLPEKHQSTKEKETTENEDEKFEDPMESLEHKSNNINLNKGDTDQYQSKADSTTERKEVQQDFEESSEYGHDIIKVQLIN